MCGRYHFSGEDAREIQEIIHSIQPDSLPIDSGEICPGNTAPVLVWSKGQVTPTRMVWGFPHFKGSGLIINARSETVMEKPMFRSSVLSRRCVVPSTGFYEWSRNGKWKTKYRFRRPGHKALYMAGCWDTFRDEDGQDRQRFVILTTEANDSLLVDTGVLSLFADSSNGRERIHDRMPVILDEREQRSWLLGGVDFHRIFNRDHIELEHDAV